MGGKNSAFPDVETGTPVQSWDPQIDVGSDVLTVTAQDPGMRAVERDFSKDTFGDVLPREAQDETRGAGSNSPSSPGGHGFTLTPDPLGPSRNKFVNLYEASGTGGNPYSYTLGTGARVALGLPGGSALLRTGMQVPGLRAKSGEAFIGSYEESATSQSEKFGSGNASPPDITGSVDYQSPGTSPGDPLKTVDPLKKVAQPMQNGMPMRKDIGDSVKSFESGSRGVVTVSSGKNDPGGVNYGTYQLSTNAGTMQKFLESPEASKYAKEFSGLKPGTREFSAKWEEVAGRDPIGFGQVAKEFVYRTHYLPKMKTAAIVGFDVDSPIVQDAVWSGSVQLGGFNKVLKSSSSPLLTYMNQEDQAKRLYSVRGEYTDKSMPNSPNSGRLRYEKEFPTLLAYHQARQLMKDGIAGRHGRVDTQEASSGMNSNIGTPVTESGVYEAYRMKAGRF